MQRAKDQLKKIQAMEKTNTNGYQFRNNNSSLELKKSKTAKGTKEK